MKLALHQTIPVILNNMPKFAGTADQVTSQMMTYNRQWILQQMRSGRPILDIGLDASQSEYLLSDGAKYDEKLFKDKS